ncbi:MAG: prepilin-type N-terminal cleavage/methylation domain-containing protein [Candidatus Omnitrophota bacterium]|jgi:prepilin-type N-terminal cleavage/methylation domain-containing protein
MKRAFTLLELIIVVIIVGILGSLGFSQYSKVVENARFSEARTKISSMRTNAMGYYLRNGSLTGITNNDLGVTNSCSSDSYFQYLKGNNDDAIVRLCAKRCTKGGKEPNVSSTYTAYMYYIPSTGQILWYKYNTDTNNPCTECAATTARYCE